MDSFTSTISVIFLLLADGNMKSDVHALDIEKLEWRPTFRKQTRLFVSAFRC